jgi:hypothetical protein
MAPDIALPPPPPRTNYFTKFGECLFVALALLDLVFTLGELLPRTLLQRAQHLIPIFIVLEFGLSIPFAFGYSLFWHIREKRGRARSPKVHAWTQGILRYWLAFEISVYGFAKLLRTQFAPIFSRDDTPVGHLTGFQLTWNYFGYSYTFAVILGLLQIGGSILLLFRRTTLLGAAILLPVMVNIVLINLFYKIAAGAFVNSIFFTLGLLFILYLHRQDLITIFLQRPSTLSPIRLNGLKYPLRLLTIAGAFGLIYYFVRNIHHSPLEGKWNVDSLVRNRDTVKGDAWLTNSGDWRSVYMEERGRLTLCPNPYVYEEARSLDGTYKYDTGSHHLQLFFDKKTMGYDDTVNMTVWNYDGRHMNWNGIMGKDTLFFALTRQ